MRIAKVVAAGAVTGAALLTGIGATGGVAFAEKPPAPSGSPSKAVTKDARAAKAASGCWYSGSHWWCNNRYGAPVVGYYGGVVGYMYSTTSWFNYRCEGGHSNNGPHPNRWEYTQADNGAWGWMSDGDISSETNPAAERRGLLTDCHGAGASTHRHRGRAEAAHRVTSQASANPQRGISGACACRKHYNAKHGHRYIVSSTSVASRCAPPTPKGIPLSKRISYMGRCICARF